MTHRAAYVREATVNITSVAGYFDFDGRAACLKIIFLFLTSKCTFSKILPNLSVAKFPPDYVNSSCYFQINKYSRRKSVAWQMLRATIIYEWDKKCVNHSVGNVSSDSPVLCIWRSAIYGRVQDLSAALSMLIIWPALQFSRHSPRIQFMKCKDDSIIL